MQRFILIFLLIMLMQSPLVAAETMVGPPLPPHLALPGKRIDLLVEHAMQKGLISGGVVLIGSREQNLYTRAYGRMSPASDALPMTNDTIFDLASLTKVIATTPSILKLAEEQKLSLVDPVRRWFPEFDGKGKDDLLVMHLLTHTSGLDDFSLTSGSALQSAIDGAAGQSSKGEPGVRFRYADINFILLGDMVRRVSGEPLNLFALKRFYEPMTMKDTGFLPPVEKRPRIAATLGEQAQYLTGEPQDFLARQLGGVAGHAGLFSTAGDLARFCRMMLAGGRLDGRAIMNERTVNQMTAPYFSRGGKIARGLGWDISSPYSAPRGGLFSRSSFGHTGYSGTSIWIDADADLFVILLTSRLDYKKIGDFRQLRGDLSTLAMEAFGKPVSLKDLEDGEDFPDGL